MSDNVLLAALSVAFVGLTGCATAKALVEPRSATVAQMREAAYVHKSIAVPVAFSMTDDDVQFSVMEENALGSCGLCGTFQGGNIVGRTIKEAISANFHLVGDDEQPVVKFQARILEISSKKSAWSGKTEAKVRIRMDMSRSGESSPAYSKVFFAAESEEWMNMHEVPSAFYSALEAVISQFLSDLDDSGTVTSIIAWNDGLMRDIVPPELKSIEWSKSGDVYCGHCEVLCNGFEGFRAKIWADRQIAAACRTKLGNIEPERVRIVYDHDEFDGRCKKWKFIFRTFARSKMVLSFDKVTQHGYATGDLGLMVDDLANPNDIDEAANELKRYILSQMDSFSGAVSSDSPKGKAMVRFDNFNTDKTYNLITIRFRLVY